MSTRSGAKHTIPVPTMDSKSAVTNTVSGLSNTASRRYDQISSLKNSTNKHTKRKNDFKHSHEQLGKMLSQKKKTERSLSDFLSSIWLHANTCTCTVHHYILPYISVAGIVFWCSICKRSLKLFSHWQFMKNFPFFWMHQFLKTLYKQRNINKVYEDLQEYCTTVYTRSGRNEM